MWLRGFQNETEDTATKPTLENMCLELYQDRLISKEEYSEFMRTAISTRKAISTDSCAFGVDGHHNLNFGKFKQAKLKLKLLGSLSSRCDG